MRHEPLPWIAALKVGDRVVSKTYAYGTTTYAIHHVTGRTPSGLVRIGTMTFYPDGQRQGEGRSYCSVKLCEVIPEIERIILAERIRSAFVNYRWGNLTDDLVIEIGKLLRDAGITGIVGEDADHA